MSDDVTRFGNIDELAWTVFRVRTGSSSYTIALYEHNGRRFAVMRGNSKNLGGQVDLRDSDPKVDGHSLFSVPPSQWVGKSLEIGTATTSRVVDVQEEKDRDVITSVTSIKAITPAPAQTAARTPRPAPESEYVEPPYPENRIEDVRIAAYLLRKVYNERRLIEDLHRNPEHLDSFKVALADAALMLKAIGGRFS